MARPASRPVSAAVAVTLAVGSVGAVSAGFGAGSASATPAPKASDRAKGLIGVADLLLHRVVGSVVTLDVLANDHGDLDPTTVIIVGGTHEGRRLVVEDEGTWTVHRKTGAITFTPEPGFRGSPEPIEYRVRDRAGHELLATTVRVGYRAQAVADRTSGNRPGFAITVYPLANDAGSLDPTTVTLEGATGAGTRLDVPGEGSWTVNATTGAISFSPAGGFEGDPTPVTYRVRDEDDTEVSAVVAHSYRPLAVDDESRDNPLGKAVAVDVLAADLGVLDPTSVTIVGAPGERRTLTVRGQGTWAVDAETGVVTFTPASGFVSDPDPVRYAAVGNGDQRVEATVAVDYLQTAAEDVSLDNAIGATVTQDVVANDTGALDPAGVRIVGAQGDGRSLVVRDVGQWKVAPTTGAIAFAPVTGYEGDPEPIRYRVAERGGDVLTARVVVDYVPVADADASDGHATGTDAVVDVLENDHGDLDPATLVLVGAEGDGRTLEVPDQGVWRVDPTAGTVTFDPAEGFADAPAPVAYRVRDFSGDETGSTLTVGYQPLAGDDESQGHAIGEVVTLDVLGEDAGSLVPGSVVIVGAPGDGRRLVVRGEGTWKVAPATGAITFTPERGFEADPTDIEYEVTDALGQRATASVTVGYLPEAGPDRSRGHAIGEVVTVDVLDGDRGDLDPTSVVIVDAPGDGKKLLVPGEGVWRVDPRTGAIRFTPGNGFLLDPTDITYRVTDTTGDSVEATVDVTYVPAAAADELLDAVVGLVARLDVLGNDDGDLDPTSVVLVGAPGDGKTLTVAGQGTWMVDPTTGMITFVPADGRQASPPPARYRVTDATGDVVTAAVRVAYTPTAAETGWANAASGVLPGATPAVGPQAMGSSAVLARTGTPVGGTVGVAGLLLGLGAALILLSRRRRLGDEPS